jgi:hypothetical protein
VFTKRLPALGLDAAGYARTYRRYVAADGAGLEAGRMPDPAPRVLLEPSLGVIAASVDARHAHMTAQVYRHDVEIISRASGHDRYVSLPPPAILAAEVHYGGFDRALLRRRAGDLPLLGCIVGLAPVPMRPLRWRGRTEVWTRVCWLRARQVCTRRSRPCWPRPQAAGWS